MLTESDVRLAIKGWIPEGVGDGVEVDVGQMCWVWRS